MTEIPDARGMLPSDWAERSPWPEDVDADASGEPCTPENPCAECKAAAADERLLEQRWTLAAADELIDLGELERVCQEAERRHADAPGGILDDDALFDLTPEPTQAMPGTPEKVAVLERRARLAQPLFHPADACFDPDAETCPQ